jgi:hypothetical protein
MQVEGETKAPPLLVECVYHPRIPPVPLIQLLLDHLKTSTTRHLPAGASTTNRR